MASSQAVRVLKSGIYNNPDHRSTGWKEPGELIVVAGGAYAESLREDGFVEFVSERDLLNAQLDALTEDLEAAELFASEEITESTDSAALETPDLAAEEVALEPPPEAPKAPTHKSRRTQKLRS